MHIYCTQFQHEQKTKYNTIIIYQHYNKLLEFIKMQPLLTDMLMFWQWLLPSSETSTNQ